MSSESINLHPTSLTLNGEEKVFILALHKYYAPGDSVTRMQIDEALREFGADHKNTVKLPDQYINNHCFAAKTSDNRRIYGTYYVPTMNGTLPSNMVATVGNGTADVDNMVAAANSAPLDTTVQIPKTKSFAHSVSVDELRMFIPSINPMFVPFGASEQVLRVIESGEFFPTLLTGLSGCGKTLLVEQACAKLNRGYVRVNIISTTDETDLFGGWRVANGTTVWHDGPVVVAMKNGYILLLDEVDLGSSKMMCLQPVLEGNAILIKQTGEVVKPKPGFNIFATANTKGEGDDTGRFIGTGVLNAAFLDRFADCHNCTWPERDTEISILKHQMKSYGGQDDVFIHHLVDWANQSRSASQKDPALNYISTRRLCAAIKGFSIFGDKKIAISKAVARFDDASKDALLKTYEMIDTQNVFGKSTAKANKKPAVASHSFTD